MIRFLEWLLRLKAGALDGADSWAPQFAADYSNWIILALVVVFGALVALTVASYLREGQVSRRVKLTLAAIRVVIIVLLLTMLFQPMLVLRYRKNLYSTVMVLLDDSLSMSLKDRYADASLRQALAEKLGVDPSRLGEMSREDIVRRLLGPGRIDAAEAERLARDPTATAKKLGIDPGELSGLSRAEAVRRILLHAGGPLEQLAQDHPLVLMRFSTANPGAEAYTRPLARLDVAGARDPRRRAAVGKEIASALSRLSGGGYETNLATALRDAAERLQGRRVAGIVVVSDGQSTSGGSAGDRLRAALAYVRQRGIPVYAVGVGDPVPPRNVAVLQLQAPAEVRKGSTVELKAFLSHRNCAGREVRVQLLRRKAGARKWTAAGTAPVTVRLEGAGENGPTRSQEVVLHAQAEELGEFEYQVRAEPLPGEFTDADNAAVAKVRVSAEQIKVLLISGDAGWEFQYLRNFLLRSPQRFGVSVWQQNAELKFNQEASSGMRLTRLPRTRPELFRYEVVILYDPAYTRGGFDGTFVEMLEDFVAEHHGGLCYIASNKNTDEILVGYGGESLDSSRPFAKLAALLPVVVDRRSINIALRITRPERTPWPVLPTVEGIDHPLMRLGTAARENADIWRVLPGVFWSHPVIRLKPLASALAVSSDPAMRTTDGSGNPVPLIAVQYYGKGRCLYLGFDETWRWRAVADGAYYRRFWSNVMDFLAAGRLQEKRVIITTGGDRFSVGEQIRVHVEAYDRDYRPLEREQLRVDMIDTATGRVRTLTLRQDPKRKAKGHYEAIVPLKAVGVFRLTAMRDDPAYKDDVADKTITVTLPQEEFRRPEADLATLRNIAPDGRFLPAHEAQRLPEIIPTGKMTVYHEAPHDLWDVPAAMVLIVGLLAAEWILRKRYNMA